MLTKIYVKELIVPAGAIIPVASVLIDGELDNEIVGMDEEEDTITLEVRYDKEERDVVLGIQKILEDYEDEEDDEEEEEEAA